jgi:putative RNA 2'-phosphotransferase
MEKELKHISKLMSLVLRHKPETIGLRLDEQGWASVDELIEKMKAAGNHTDRSTIIAVVEGNDKQRFAFNEDQSKIRANQGHSLSVDLSLEAQQPPEYLYHGTAIDFLDSILEKGLQKQRRQHVHLSDNAATAKAVGGRHGKPVVLIIAASAMATEGFTFYQSANKVWLTGEVPPAYIRLSES